jgi:hypothetical protein
VSDQSETNPVDTLNPGPPQLGRIKTFGPVGPPYEVGEPLRRLDDGDWLVRVTIVQTGELAEYRLSRIVDDPDAV